MNQDELDRIAALYEASTQGDWIADSQNYPNEIKSSKQHQGFVEAYNTGDAELIVAIHNALPALIALARKGVMRLDAGLTTAEPIELAAFQSAWLVMALQAGDTITLNGQVYTSHDGRVWQRDDETANGGGGTRR